MTKLKKCPFCGEKEKIQFVTFSTLEGEKYGYECMICNAIGPLGFDVKGATEQCSKAKARLQGLGISAREDDFSGKVEIRLWNGIDQIAEMLGKTAEECYDILGEHEKRFKYKGVKITQKPKLKEEYYLPIRETES